MRTTRSSEKLAQSLHACGLSDLERRARANEFSDYNGPHAMPQHKLVEELRTLERPENRQQVQRLIRRVIDGDFDASMEESDAWWEREGRDVAKDLPPNIRSQFEKPS